LCYAPGFSSVTLLLPISHLLAHFLTSPLLAFHLWLTFRCMGRFCPIGAFSFPPPFPSPFQRFRSPVPLAVRPTKNIASVLPPLNLLLGFFSPWSPAFAAAPTALESLEGLPYLLCWTRFLTLFLSIIDVYCLREAQFRTDLQASGPPLVAVFSCLRTMMDGHARRVLLPLLPLKYHC